MKISELKNLLRPHSLDHQVKYLYDYPCFKEVIDRYTICPTPEQLYKDICERFLAEYRRDDISDEEKRRMRKEMNRFSMRVYGYSRKWREGTEFEGKCSGEE